MPDRKTPGPEAVSPAAEPVGTRGVTADEQFHRPPVDPNLSVAKGADATADAPPGPADTAEKKTVEQWAEAKGYLPQMQTVPATVAGQQTTAPSANPRYHLFAQAKALRNWPEGTEVSEAEFDKAVEEANNVPLK